MRTETTIRNLFRSVPDDAAAQQRLRSLALRVAHDAPQREPRRALAARSAPVLAGALSVLAIIVAVALVVGRGSGRSPDQVPGATSSSTATATALPTQLDPAPTSPAAADVPLTPQAAVAQLIRLVGNADGAFSAPSGRIEQGFIIGQVTFDDGAGESLLEVQVSAATEADIAAFCSNDQQVCRTLGDGTHVQTIQRTDTTAAGAPTRWIARALRPDGLAVDISELNSGSAAEPPTRSEPPIGINPLIAIAASPEWALTITAESAQSAAGLF